MKAEKFRIYGYEELVDRWKNRGLSHPRWYVGVTQLRWWEDRHSYHSNPPACNTAYWPNWVRARKAEGYSLDQVTRRVILQEVTCTTKEARRLEEEWTDFYDAEAPTGFVTQVGGYGGRVAACVEERRVKRYMETCKTPEYQAGKSASGKKAWAEQRDSIMEKNISTRAQRKKERYMPTLMKKAKSAKIKLSNKDLCELIVLGFNREMTDKEVKQELAKIGIKARRAFAYLMRAAGYNARTSEKTSKFEQAKIVRKECIGEWNSRWVFLPKQLAN